MGFFELLETRYSTVNDRKFLEKKWGTYLPDIFLTFFFTSLIVSTCFLDLFLAVFIFYETNIILWAVFLVASYLRLIFELMVDLKPKVTSVRNVLPLTCLPFKLLLTILGLHSISTSSIIMREAFKNPNIPVILPHCKSYPVFSMSNENLSIIKIYCYIHVGVKCIPQLFIMSVFIGTSHPSWIVVYMSTANIFLNMVLFSFMISITLPIRKTSRVFVTFYCHVFSAFNKFLATLSGCCASMVVFMAMFKTVKYYAFLGHFSKMIIWIIPCQALLSRQNLPTIYFLIYLFYLPLIFSFVFIHPFERTWMLYYFFFYLFSAVLDLALLGIWAGGEVIDLSFYSILRFLQVLFISYFGLLNGLKGKECKMEVFVVQNADEVVKEEESKSGTSNEESESEIVANNTENDDL